MLCSQPNYFNMTACFSLFLLPNSHVLDGEVLEYLAIVDVPHSLVVPHLARQQDRAESDPLPAARRDVHLGVLGA